MFGIAQGLPGTDIRALHQDRGGTLWAATMTGLARFDGRGFVAVKSAGVPLDGIVAIFEDRAGTLWFGSAGEGLVRFRDGEFKVFTTRDGLASNKVLAFHEDVRGSLWIGSGGGGLTRLRDGRFATIRTSNGLWDGIAQTILEDRAGNLWMTCNRGFYRVSRNELDQFADGRLARVASVGYGASDALRSTTFAGGQSPSGAIDSRGQLWLPSYDGLVVVDPSNVPPPNVAPAVRLEEVKTNGIGQETGQAVMLPPGGGTLSIRYTAMTLIDADRVHFRWRMEGLAADWVETGTGREAFYSSLPHGSYRFQVAASADGQNWSEASAPLDVTVRPFFYQTPWFAALVTICGVGAAAGGLKWRLRQHRRREADLQQRVNRALADVQTLRGLLPICAWCKKVRNDAGYWEQIEVYVRNHSEATFSHGICPECLTQVDPTDAGAQPESHD